LDEETIGTIKKLQEKVAEIHANFRHKLEKCSDMLKHICHLKSKKRSQKQDQRKAKKWNGLSEN